MAVKRWVMQRKSDGMYWASYLGKHPWMPDVSEAQLLDRSLAKTYASSVQRAVQVTVTIKPAKRGGRP